MAANFSLSPGSITRPQLLIAHEICDFAVGCGDGDYRPASGGDTVELAWDNQPFKGRFERQPVQVGNAKRVREKGTFLIGDEAKACGKTARFYEVCEFLEVMPASNEKKHDAGIVTESFARSEDGVELMGTAEITGIADDKLVLELPQFAQSIFLVGDRSNFYIIRPVMNHLDAVRCYSAFYQSFRHAFSDHHINCGRFEGAVAPIRNAICERSFKQRDTEFDGYFGINILQPVDETGPLLSSCPHGEDGAERRIGHGDDGITRLNQVSH